MLHSMNLGVDFTRSATIGRQGLSISPERFIMCLNEFGYQCSHSGISDIYKDNYADVFFEKLGATRVDSFDNSDYEHATCVHDMNNPINPEYHEKYSMLYDGGSLEHVFNFPVAIKNCMEMVEVGAHFITAPPTNGYMGPGFYQFRQDLYFSILTPENGFQIEDFIAFAPTSPKWYSVASPRVLKRRVSMKRTPPVLLMIRAKRIEKKKIFETTPQQSDYQTCWQKKEERQEIQQHLPQKIILKSKAAATTKRILSQNINPFLKKISYPLSPVFRRKFFTRTYPQIGTPDKTVQTRLES